MLGISKLLHRLLHRCSYKRDILVLCSFIVIIIFVCASTIWSIVVLLLITGRWLNWTSSRCSTSHVSRLLPNHPVPFSFYVNSFPVRLVFIPARCILIYPSFLLPLPNFILYANTLFLPTRLIRTVQRHNISLLSLRFQWREITLTEVSTTYNLTPIKSLHYHTSKLLSKTDTHNC